MFYIKLNMETVLKKLGIYINSNKVSKPALSLTEYVRKTKKKKSLYSK